MSMPGGMSAFHAYRGFTSDKSVVGQRLGRETLKRIGG